MSFNNSNADLSSLRINRESSPVPQGGAKKKLTLYLSIAGLIIAVGIIFFTINGTSLTEKIEVATASFTYPSQANTVLTASGYVVAQVKAAVASKGTGRLEYLAVIEGDHVKKGNIIGRIESADVEAQLGQTKANLSFAHAALESAQADLEDASAHFERQKTLFAQGSISKAEYDGANARYKRAVAGIASATAGIQSAQANVRAAEVQVENTFIRAPFDGTVLNKNANVGEVITPFGAAAGSRGALVILADMSSLEVEADVSESNIEKIIPNQQCEITLDAFPEKRYRGFVHKIIPTADRAKATVLTKIRFNDRDDRVLPEMSAKVLFLNKKENSAVENSAPKLTVPSSAVVQRNGRNVVFIVREEKVTETSVVLGDSMGALVEVKEGVANGDTIVLHPSATLSSGTKISVEGK